MLDDHLNKLGKTKIFVETGLQYGEGVKIALKAGFEKIYSIELREKSCDEGRKKFKQQIANGRVRIIHGKSEEMLQKVIENIHEPITFWLDAHLAPDHLDTIGMDTYDKWCPLYDELEVIKRHHVKNHVILIDDIDRLEEGHNWTDEVDLGTIRSRVLGINPHYIINTGAILYARLIGKTVAFDLDDVICFRDETLCIESAIGPDKYEGCQPNPDKIKIINDCYDDGYIIVLYTSRGMGQFNGNTKRCDNDLREVTTRSLKIWGVKYHQLVFGKIHFDLLIDDKVRNSEGIRSLQDVKTAIGDS